MTQIAISEAERLHQLAHLTALFFNKGISATNLFAHLIKMQDGRTAWTAGVHPERVLPQSFEAGPFGPWFLQSDIDALLEYIDHERETTGDSVSSILSELPAMRYLALCDRVSLLREELVIRDAAPLAYSESEYSVITVRTVDSAHSVRVTFTYEEIRIEVLSPDEMSFAFALNCLWSSSAKDLSWDVLRWVRETLKEMSV